MLWLDLHGIPVRTDLTAHSEDSILKVSESVLAVEKDISLAVEQDEIGPGHYFSGMTDTVLQCN